MKSKKKLPETTLEFMLSYPYHDEKILQQARDVLKELEARETNGYYKKNDKFWADANKRNIKNLSDTIKFWEKRNASENKSP